MSNIRGLSQLASVLSVQSGTENIGLGEKDPGSKLTVVGDGLVSGVVTATAYYGSGENLTGVLHNVELELDKSPKLGGDLNLGGKDIVGAGNITINGNVSIDGNLEYVDVTHITSDGLINARKGIVVGEGHGINAPTGEVIAKKFKGDLQGTADAALTVKDLKLSGDVTSENTVTTLATVNYGAGTYGDASTIPVITVNEKGLVTSVEARKASIKAILADHYGKLNITSSGVGISASGVFSAGGKDDVTINIQSNATSRKDAGTIVSRDASGNFEAGTITARLNGTANNADKANVANSAHKLAIARPIEITGAIVGSAVFDGTSRVEINTSINENGVIAAMQAQIDALRAEIEALKGN